MVMNGDYNFKVKPDGEVEKTRSHGLFNCDEVVRSELRSGEE